MTWEAALQSVYVGNTSSSLDDLSYFFDNAVLPAFEEIETCLSEYVSKTRITPHKYLAKLYIEDMSFGKFVFVTEAVKEQSNVRFYSVLNGEQWNSPDFEYNDLKTLGKEVVQHEFTKLFLSRNKNQEKLLSKNVRRKIKLRADLTEREISVLTGIGCPTIKKNIKPNNMAQLCELAFKMQQSDILKGKYDGIVGTDGLADIIPDKIYLRKAYGKLRDAKGISVSG